MNHSLTTTVSPSFSLNQANCQITITNPSRLLNQITQVPEPLAHLQQQSVLTNVTELQRLLNASRSIKSGKLSQITLILYQRLFRASRSIAPAKLTQRRSITIHRASRSIIPADDAKQSNFNLFTVSKFCAALIV